MGAASLAGLAFASNGEGASAADPRPNVLFMLTDDQPPHTVRKMRRTMARFSGGLDLTDTGYCAVPMCGPDRASLLTGLYPHNHGCLNNTNPNTYDAYREKAHEENDLISRMAGAGYSVGFFGKFINGFGTNAVPNAWVHPAADMWHVVAGSQNTYPFPANKQGRIIQGIERNHTEYFGAQAERFMEKLAAGPPWFCYLNWIDTHNPYQPTGAFDSSHDGEAYVSLGTEEEDLSDKTYLPADPRPDSFFQDSYEGILEELETVDVWVERLFAMLKRTGQLRNTIVIFSSDNGFMLGEHGGYSHKSHPYEESARVPFLVRGPGVPTRGLPDQPLVSNLDITATILAAADAPLSDLDGRPLQELAGGGWRKRVLVEHPVRGWSMVRDGDLVYMDRARSEEMYDLADDPYQVSGLQNDPARAEQMADLSRKLAGLSGATGEGLRAAETA